MFGLAESALDAIDGKAPTVIWTVPFAGFVLFVAFAIIVFDHSPVGNALGVPDSGDVKVGFGDGFWRIDLLDKVSTFVGLTLIFVDLSVETDGGVIFL